MKRITAIAIVLVLLFMLAVPVFATDDTYDPSPVSPVETPPPGDGGIGGGDETPPPEGGDTGDGEDDDGSHYSPFTGDYTVVFAVASGLTALCAVACFAAARKKESE